MALCSSVEAAESQLRMIDPTTEEGRAAPVPPPPLPGFPSYNAGRGSAGAQNCANQENGWWQYFQSIAGEKTYRNSFVLWSHWGPSSLCSTPRDKKGLRQSVYFIHQGRESITCPQQLSSRSMMERKLILYTWGLVIIALVYTATTVTLFSRPIIIKLNNQPRYVLEDES